MQYTYIAPPNGVERDHEAVPVPGGVSRAVILVPNANANPHALKMLNQDAPLKANSCHFHPLSPHVLARYATAQVIQGILLRQIPPYKADTYSVGPSSRTTGQSMANGRCGYREVGGYCPFRRRVLSRWRWYHGSALGTGTRGVAWEGYLPRVLACHRSVLLLEFRLPGFS
jgi:hypothetical protein